MRLDFKILMQPICTLRVFSKHSLILECILLELRHTCIPYVFESCECLYLTIGFPTPSVTLSMSHNRTYTQSKSIVLSQSWLEMSVLSSNLTWSLMCYNSLMSQSSPSHMHLKLHPPSMPCRLYSVENLPPSWCLQSQL